MINITEENNNMEENKIIRGILNKLNSFFNKKKKIKMIYVDNGQKFWVKNPKQILFWKTLAEGQASRLLFNKEITGTTIQIKKVIYEGK